MLNIKELDKKLIELSKEKHDIDCEYEEVEQDIEELEYKRDCLESRYDGIESEIKNIKDQILTNKIDELNIDTKDKFLQDFIKASWFCSKEEGMAMLQYVKLTNDGIIGCDGYRAILIKSDIPQELKNTFVKWYVRENFKDAAKTKINLYPDVENLFEDAEKETIYAYGNLTCENFYESFGSKDLKGPNHPCVIKCNDIKIGFSKDLMKDALMVLKNNNFTLKITGKVKPILLENKYTKIMVLPVRLNG